MADPIIKAVWESSGVIDVLGFLTGADASILQALQATLVEGGQCGEDVRKLASRVQIVIDMDRTSAMLITRSAVGYVLSRARHESAINAGMTHKTWLHAPACHCEGHAEADAAYKEDPIPIRDPFLVNGQLLQYPRDFNCERPQECVGCACLLLTKRLRRNNKRQPRNR